MNFTQNTYYQEKFSKVDLTGAALKSIAFEECEFSACSFIDCKFEKCKFINCKFNECILSAVIPMDCRFLETQFSGSKVIGIDWAKAQLLREPVFTACQINYSSFKLMIIPKIKIINCEAKEVDFTETDLSHGIFKNTDFEKSRFFKTNLTQADFKGAKNYFIDTRTCILKQTRFSLPEALALLHSLDIVLE